VIVAEDWIVEELRQTRSSALSCATTPLPWQANDLPLVRLRRDDRETIAALRAFRGGGNARRVLPVRFSCG
jgi:hypothetical protein